MDDLKMHFSQLVQGNRLVYEYERDFLRLSLFAVASESLRCRRFREGLNIDIHSYLAADLPEGFSELVRQAKAVEKVLSMRLSSTDESSIQSKRASNTPSLSQIATKRSRDSRGFKRAPSTQFHRSGQGSRLGACRRPLASSSLASLEGSVRTPTFLVCNLWLETSRGVLSED